MRADAFRREFLAWEMTAGTFRRPFLTWKMAGGSFRRAFRTWKKLRGILRLPFRTRRKGKCSTVAQAETCMNETGKMRLQTLSSKISSHDGFVSTRNCLKEEFINASF